MAVLRRQLDEARHINAVASATQSASPTAVEPVTAGAAITNTEQLTQLKRDLEATRQELAAVRAESDELVRSSSDRIRALQSELDTSVAFSQEESASLKQRIADLEVRLV